MVEVKVVKGRLGDGTTVYNVHIRQLFDVEPDASRVDGSTEEQTVILPATSEDNADGIAGDLVRAVNDRTFELAEYVD